MEFQATILQIYWAYEETCSFFSTTSIPTYMQCRNHNLLEQVGTSPDQVPLLIQRITGCPLRT